MSNAGDVNPLSAYISRRDHIYQRIVFLPFTTFPMYPLNFDKQLPEYQNRVKRNIDVFGTYFINEPKRLLIYELLEQNLQTYLSESVHFLKCYLYKITAKSIM